MQEHQIHVPAFTIGPDTRPAHLGPTKPIKLTRAEARALVRLRHGKPTKGGHRKGIAARTTESLRGKKLLAGPSVTQAGILRQAPSLTRPWPKLRRRALAKA